MGHDLGAGERLCTPALAVSAATLVGVGWGRRWRSGIIYAGGTELLELQIREESDSEDDDS